MKKKQLFIIFFLSITAFMAACSGEKQQEADQTHVPKIVTSFFPVYEFTKAIVGDRTEISLLVDGNKDPHSYEPSAKDMAELNGADVFIYTGEEMEFWVPSMLQALENEDLSIVRTADGSENVQAHEEMDKIVTPFTSEGVEASIVGVGGHYHTGDLVTLRIQYSEELDWQWYIKFANEDWESDPVITGDRFEYEASTENFYVQAVGRDADEKIVAQSPVEMIHINNHDGKDPHIWLDPVLAQEQVKIIRDALISLNPEGKFTYTSNAEVFIKQLQELDAAYRTTFETAENRTFIVQHQAFGYLAMRYNLNQVAVGGISTEIEPSPARIAEIGKEVESHHVPVIYYQQGSNSAIAQTVAKETGTKTAALFDLETEPTDLDETGNLYLEAMYKNLESLKMSVK